MARGPWITAHERKEIRRRIPAGDRARHVAVALGRQRGTIHLVLRQAGGIAPRRAVIAQTL